MIKIQSVFTTEHWKSISLKAPPYHLLIEFKPGFEQKLPRYISNSFQQVSTSTGLIIAYPNHTGIEAVGELIGNFNHRINLLYKELLITEKCSDKKVQRKICTNERLLKRLLKAELSALNLILN